MKILVAVEATDHKAIVDAALRWAGRAGYDFRVFVPPYRIHLFRRAIDDANYHYYTGLEPDILVKDSFPEDYAARYEYDLLLKIPEHLLSWRKGAQFQPAEMAHYTRAVGAARLWFGRYPGRGIKRFANGATMQRVQ